MSAFNDDKLELVRLQAERNHAARGGGPPLERGTTQKSVYPSPSLDRADDEYFAQRQARIDERAARQNLATIEVDTAVIP